MQLENANTKYNKMNSIRTVPPLRPRLRRLKPRASEFFGPSSRTVLGSRKIKKIFEKDNNKYQNIKLTF